MTPEQRAARITVMLSLREPLTQKEKTELASPYAEWPDELKAKAGRLAELVRIEDEKAVSG